MFQKFFKVQEVPISHNRIPFHPWLSEELLHKRTHIQETMLSCLARDDSESRILIQEEVQEMSAP